MELYLNLLKVLVEDKDSYLKYKDVLEREFLRENFPEVLRLVNTVDVVHQKVEGNASLVDLEALFYAAYPAADKELYEEIFKRLRDAKGSPAACREYLRSLKERSDAARLGQLALSVAEGRASAAELVALTSAWSEVKEEEDVDEAEKYLVSDDIEVLHEHFIQQPGLKWRLKSLNRSLGPLRKGNFGFIFARPETGKTTLLASEFTYMVRQADGPCVWFNNEEVGEQVMYRLYSASLGATREQLDGNLGRAKQLFWDRTQRRVRFIDYAGVDRYFIERYCRRVKPSLVVIDQLDKIKGFDGDREDLRMGAIYQWARELAKMYCPVIGVSQSDGSGEGVKYLNMGNVANAKTAKQAEADWIVGVGLDYNDPPWVRGISVCKNKLPGGEESVPKLRHGHWEVIIKPEIARYIDVGDDNDEGE